MHATYMFPGQFDMHIVYELLIHVAISFALPYSYNIYDKCLLCVMLMLFLTLVASLLILSVEPVVQVSTPGRNPVYNLFLTDKITVRYTWQMFECKMLVPDFCPDIGQFLCFQQQYHDLAQDTESQYVQD